MPGVAPAAGLVVGDGRGVRMRVSGTRRVRVAAQPVGERVRQVDFEQAPDVQAEQGEHEGQEGHEQGILELDSPSDGLPGGAGEQRCAGQCPERDQDAQGRHQRAADDLTAGLAGRLSEPEELERDDRQDARHAVQDQAAEQCRDQHGEEAQASAGRRGRRRRGFECGMTGRFAGVADLEAQRRLGGGGRQADEFVAGLIQQLDRHVDGAGREAGRRLHVDVDHRFDLVGRERILRELRLPHDVGGIADDGLGPALRQIQGEFGGNQILVARRVALDVPTVVDRHDGGKADGRSGGVGREVGEGLDRGLGRRPELAARSHRKRQSRREKDGRSERLAAVTILLHAFR